MKLWIEGEEAQQHVIMTEDGMLLSLMLQALIADFPIESIIVELGGEVYKLMPSDEDREKFRKIGCGCGE